MLVLSTLILIVKNNIFTDCIIKQIKKKKKKKMILYFK
jgi:hypothetical protein